MRSTMTMTRRAVRARHASGGGRATSGRRPNCYGPRGEGESRDLPGTDNEKDAHQHEDQPRGED